MSFLCGNTVGSCFSYLSVHQQPVSQIRGSMEAASHICGKHTFFILLDLMQSEVVYSEACWEAHLFFQAFVSRRELVVYVCQ